MACHPNPFSAQPDRAFWNLSPAPLCQSCHPTCSEVVFFLTPMIEVPLFLPLLFCSWPLGSAVGGSSAQMLHPLNPWLAPPSHRSLHLRVPSSGPLPPACTVAFFSFTCVCSAVRWSVPPAPELLVNGLCPPPCLAGRAWQVLRAHEVVLVRMRE